MSNHEDRKPTDSKLESSSSDEQTLGSVSKDIAAGAAKGAAKGAIKGAIAGAIEGATDEARKAAAVAQDNTEAKKQD